MRFAQRSFLLLAVVGATDLCGSVARGDGGTVRLLTSAGPYRLTVFCDPTPLRAGPIDVSVLVQDAVTGAVVTDCRVLVTLRNAADPTAVRAVEATMAAATNKLLRSALLELPKPGRWRAEVTVDGPPGACRVEVPLDVLERLSPWRDVAVWIMAPLVPIGLFVLRELLAAGRRR